jgi:hypothetical protein
MRDQEIASEKGFPNEVELNHQSQHMTGSNIANLPVIQRT